MKYENDEWWKQIKIRFAFICLWYNQMIELVICKLPCLPPSISLTEKLKLDDGLWTKWLPGTWTLHREPRTKVNWFHFYFLFVGSLLMFLLSVFCGPWNDETKENRFFAFVYTKMRHEGSTLVRVSKLAMPLAKLMVYDENDIEVEERVNSHLVEFYIYFIVSVERLSYQCILNAIIHHRKMWATIFRKRNFIYNIILHKIQQGILFCFPNAMFYILHYIVIVMRCHCFKSNVIPNDSDIKMIAVFFCRFIFDSRMSFSRKLNENNFFYLS